MAPSDPNDIAGLVNCSLSSSPLPIGDTDTERQAALETAKNRKPAGYEPIEKTDNSDLDGHPTFFHIGKLTMKPANDSAPLVFGLFQRAAIVHTQLYMLTCSVGADYIDKHKPIIEQVAHTVKISPDFHESAASLGVNIKALIVGFLVLGVFGFGPAILLRWVVYRNPLSKKAALLWTLGLTIAEALALVQLTDTRKSVLPVIFAVGSYIILTVGKARKEDE